MSANIGSVKVEISVVQGVDHPMHQLLRMAAALSSS